MRSSAATATGLENLRNYISNLWRAEDLTMRYFAPAETSCVIYYYLGWSNSGMRKKQFSFIGGGDADLKIYLGLIKNKILEAID